VRRQIGYGIAAGLLLVAAAAGLPLVRAVALLQTPSRHSPLPPADLAVAEVSFPAADGVPLAGGLARARPGGPAVALVAGFKEDRLSMLPYARFLRAAGYTVLLYDSRGVGRSGGSFSLGLREVADARDAVAYLRRAGLASHGVGLLGVSLGAGVAIAAAASDPLVTATVADSAYVDQTRTVSRLDTLALGPLRLPLLPVAPWAVDHLLGTPLAAFSPLQAVGHIAPHALLLIHSRDDTNPTTPLAGALALRRAARGPVELWIAPRGGHAGALAANPIEYRRRVLAFLRRYLQPARR